MFVRGICGVMCVDIINNNWYVTVVSRKTAIYWLGVYNGNDDITICCLIINIVASQVFHYYPKINVRKNNDLKVIINDKVVSFSIPKL